MKMLALAAALAVAVPLPPPITDPLICVRTGAVYVGPHSYDPPDPCVL